MSRRRGEPVRLEALGLVLEPLKFMEYLLEGTTQAALFSREGACLINLPDPARFAVHKLIVAAERKGASRGKSAKDVEQAAALAEWQLASGQARAFKSAWLDALGRGRGWQERAKAGRRLLLARHAALDDPRLWGRG